MSTGVGGHTSLDGKRWQTGSTRSLKTTTRLLRWIPRPYRFKPVIRYQSRDLSIGPGFRNQSCHGKHTVTRRRKTRTTNGRPGGDKNRDQTARRGWHAERSGP